jgi:hypothetical protein
MTDNELLGSNGRHLKEGFDSPGSILFKIAFAAGFQRGVGEGRSEGIRSVHMTESKYGLGMSVTVFPAGRWAPQPDG